jgi:CRISPR-associated exonuclease Cas4
LLWDVFFVPAVKDVLEELNTRWKSIFSQLLERVINQMSTNNQAYRAAKEQIGTLIQTLNKQAPWWGINTQRPAELSWLEQRMSEELTNRGAIIDIEITPPEIDDVFKLWTNVRVDDGIKTDASRKWNWLQRWLIFALIKSWVNIIKEEMEAMEWDANASTRQKSKSFYFILLWNNHYIP